MVRRMALTHVYVGSNPALSGGRRGEPPRQFIHFCLSPFLELPGRDGPGETWAGSVAANAPDCKSGTSETTKVRVLPCPYGQLVKWKDTALSRR